MKRRTVKKQFWFSRDEAQDLQKKAKKTCLTEAALVRLLVRGYEPKERPDERFYDVMRLTNLFKSTTPKGSQSNDPFWDTAASMLLLALVFYLHYEAPEDEQNFAMIMEMLRAGAIEDEEEPRPSPLDNLFSELEYENPDHIALKYYHSYHSGSAKTLKSIQITLAARLEKFNLESLASLTSTDELELETLGEKKTALFALIPDNDTSFNFLVSILYTQLFQQLFYSADHIHGGSLPIPVHFLMDEFANVSLPDDFDKILSVMRSRSVSVSIILQNLAQLKAFDVLEMSGSRAVWKEVLSVYSVKVNTDPDNPQEVATMDDSKKQLLKDIFWEMNSISSRTESKSETVITETDDGNGNIVQTETTVTRTYLYITVSHKTVDEMAAQYGFNQEQKDYLTELLQDKNNSLWSSVLYGITASDDQIVTVALSQIGNVGGEPYWSWYGFGSRVEWCACFVSWCANECGYIDTGVIPKFAGCVNGVQWFKDRGQWMDGSAEPVPGMIIFFDWDNKGSSGPQDGLSDHVGIVQKVENGIVYTVEGNSGDSVRVNQYSVGHYEVLGNGVPQY